MNFSIAPPWISIIFSHPQSPALQGLRQAANAAKSRRTPILAKMDVGGGGISGFNERIPYPLIIHYSSIIDALDFFAAFAHIADDGSDPYAVDCA